MKKIIFAIAGLTAALSFASQAETPKTTVSCETMMQQQQMQEHHANHTMPQDHHTSSEQQWKTPVLNTDPRVTNK